jgi:Protein of unknown function (DUF2851)
VKRVGAEFYGQWRAQRWAASACHDVDPDAAPDERLLQQVWQHQRLKRDRLTTVDGRRLCVLHPGFWNREAGPDFHGAVLQFEGQAPCSGDVEIDRHTHLWQTHHHARNPAYRNVILHVVWATDGAVGTRLPVLALKPVLDAALDQLRLWVGTLPRQSMPEALRGRCCEPLSRLATPARVEVLRQAALARLRQKAELLQAHARQIGWEQTLWAGLLRGLGYKHNVWPMQRVAELRPRLLGRDEPLSPLALQAVLLGVANLLPEDLKASRAKSHLRGLWDHWWRVRDEFADLILPRSLWRFAGLRPANQPYRRLALAAHWLARDDLFARLGAWFVSELPRPARRLALWQILNVERDEFWAWHWTLRSPRLDRPQPLLGAARVTDLAMNVILPWFWMRAVAGENEVLRGRAEQFYLEWPAGQDNAILRLARQRLLADAPARGVPTAAA